MADFYSEKHLFDSAEIAASFLAGRIIDQTKFFIQQNGKCVWAVSGGNSIHKLYSALKEYKSDLKAFSKNLTVMWVDERVVPHTDENSNFGNAYKDFWKFFDDVQLIPVPYHKEIDQAAYQYAELLSENGIEDGDVDITVLGMGADGHTASLFPNSKALKEESSKIVGVDDPSLQQPRVSLTYPFINSSKAIYLYFYGEEKAGTFRQAELSGDVDSYPILGIDHQKMEIYSDRDLN